VCFCAAVAVIYAAFTPCSFFVNLFLLLVFQRSLKSSVPAGGGHIFGFISTPDRNNNETAHSA
jgi:hypothetical protein